MKACSLRHSSRIILASLLLLPLLKIPARAQDSSDRRTAKLEIGIDRSNMATEWTLSPPSEPDIDPFNAPYNGAGV